MANAYDAANDDDTAGYQDPTDETDTVTPEDDNSDEAKDAFFRKARQWYRLDRQHLADWRKDAITWYDYRAGKQWSEADEQLLKEQGRPVVTFNRIAPTIDSVVGIEIGNRREVQYTPRQIGAAVPNEIITAAGEWVRDETDAETAESDCFGDTVTVGYGWTDTRMEYECDPDGMIEIEKLDPLEMLYDYSARKNNLLDARRMWRIREMPCSDAEALFPDADYGDLHAGWAKMEDPTKPHNADPDMAYNQGDQMGNDRDGDDEDKMITLVHVQWYEKEPYKQVAHTQELHDLGIAPPEMPPQAPMQPGQPPGPPPKMVHNVPQKDYQTLVDRVNGMATAQGKPEPKIIAAPMVRRVYKQAWIGRKVLTIEPNAYPKGFTWQCVTGNLDRNKGTFFGLVKPMKDPQEWANKWLSQIMHIMNSNAKGGILAEESAFANWKDAEKSWAKADRITKVADGTITGGKWAQKPATEFPSGFQALLQFAITSIPDVTGMSYEMLGTANRDQPGVLEDQRKQAGMTILAKLFDNLRRYRKNQGKVMLHFITEYLSDDRLIKIIGMKDADGNPNPDAQYVPLTKQPDFLEYDVVVDDSPTSPNQKEKIWQIIQAILPMFGASLSPETILALLKYSPFPSSVVRDLQDAHDKQQQAQQATEERQKQMMIEDHQAKMGKTQSETEKNTATAQKTMVDAHVNASTPIAPPQSQQGGSAQTAPPHPATTGAEVATAMANAQKSAQQARQASAMADLAEVKTQNAQLDTVQKVRQLNDPFAGVKVK